MKVDVWLDIRCPNCYIGKRRFEAALSRFEHAGDVSLEFHSYELSTTITSMPGKSVYEYLAELKGKSLEWSHQVYANVKQAAAQIGLEYNFDKTVIANSFDAHRVFQHAKKNGKASETLERFYYAYFTEGLDIGDRETITRLAVELGFDEKEIRAILKSGQYSADVRGDESRAAELVISGVPFFLLNGTQGMSGSQSIDIYLQSLREAWEIFEKQKMGIGPEATDDDCAVQGFC